MNIDLLETGNGEFGVVSDQDFKSPVAGVMYDTRAQTLSLEFVNLDSMEMNIPIDEIYGQKLFFISSLQIGTIENGALQDSRQVPLLLINNSNYHEDHNTNDMFKTTNSVTRFEYFLKSCISGQPLHRDDLGNEDKSYGVTAGLNRAILDHAPHLARQKTMEINAPSAAPNTPAPRVPGMGPGGARGGTASSRQYKPSTKRTNKKDD